MILGCPAPGCRIRLLLTSWRQLVPFFVFYFDEFVAMKASDELRCTGGKSKYECLHNADPEFC